MATSLKRMINSAMSKNKVATGGTKVIVMELNSQKRARPSSSPVRMEMYSNAMSSSFVSAASAFVSPTAYSSPKPPTKRPTRRPTPRPTPRLPNTSEHTQLSVPMKGEDPKPHGSSSFVVTVKTQNQNRPVKKTGKKKKKQKIVPQQFNAAKKKGKKKTAKKRPTQ